AVPDEIIGDEGEILYRPIVRGVEIEKEVVTKRFEDEKRTFNERVVSNQKRIVPNQLALQRRQMHDEADQGENDETGPLFFPQLNEATELLSTDHGERAKRSCLGFLIQRSVLPVRTRGRLA